MSFKGLGLAYACIGLFCSSLALSAPQFKTNLNLKAFVDQSVSTDLRTFLSDEGSGRLEWSADKDKPAWFQLDSRGNLGFGKPALSDLGIQRFQLQVKDTVSQAVVSSTFELQVVARPNWSVAGSDGLDLGIQPEGVPFNLDLKKLVTVPGGGEVVFSGSDLPDWLKLSSDGGLAGTPRRADVTQGVSFQLTARTKPAGEPSSVKAHITVQKTVQPPKWRKGQFSITPINQDTDMQQNVADSVLNIEKTPLTFELLSVPAPPQWLKIRADGLLYGRPGQRDVGTSVVKVKVSSKIEGQLYSVATSLTITVVGTKHAPEWLANPLPLPNANAGSPYSQNLNKSVVNPDGNALTFEISSEPAWVSVDKNSGVFGGTPPPTESGLHTWVLKVTNADGLSNQTTVQVNVIRPPQSPIWSKHDMVLSGVAQEDQYFSVDLKPYVKNPDGVVLNFKRVTGPKNEWASISSEGILSGVPSRENVPKSVFLVRVQSNAGNDETSVEVPVQHVNHAPKWVLSPIQETFNQGEKVDLNLSEWAKDSDNDPLTFSLVDPPAGDWVTLTPDGRITGTVPLTQTATSTYKVRVDDGNGGQADCIITINYVHTNQPPHWSANPLKLTGASVGALFKATLSDFARDADPGAILHYRKLLGPTWLTVDDSGAISGTPGQSDLGQNEFQVEVRDSNDLADTTQVNVQVDASTAGPKWTKNPLPLGTAAIGKAFSFDLSQSIDGTPQNIKFAKVKGPDWLSVAANGMISGTPVAPAGDFTALFEASNGIGKTQVIAFGTVGQASRPPRWSQDPINLGTANVGSLFQLDLATLASDPDASSLTFRKVDGPNWMSVAQNGKLTGTPQATDLGMATAKFEVTDGTTPVTADAFISVAQGAQPPIIHNISLIFKINQSYDVSLNDTAYVTDPNGKSLTFQLTDAQSLPWLTVATRGALHAKPLFANIGEYNVKFSVSNGTASADGSFHVSVVDNPQAPVWNNQTFLLKAAVGQNFSDTLVGKATAESGRTISFAKKSGPDWLGVDASGLLSGTPPKASTDLFVVTATVGGQSADANLVIEVDANSLPPIVHPIAFALKERQAMTQNLNQVKYVEDPAGKAMSFTLLESQPPTWLQLDTTGKLTLSNPTWRDIGTRNYKFQVSDGTATTVGAFSVEVQKDPQVPQWIVESLSYSTVVGTSFSVDVKAKCVDPDGRPLLFFKKKGPAWIGVTSEGVLSGTPVQAGTETLVVTASNGGKSSDINVVLTTNGGGTPPQWTTPTLALGTATVGTLFQFDLTPYAKDSQGKSLTFRLVNGPTWLSVTSAGMASGTPAVKDVGAFAVTVEVSNGSLTAQADGLGSVSRGTSFGIKSIALAVSANQEVRVALNDPNYISNPAGAVLKFSLTDIPLPAWVVMDTAGQMRLTPTATDVGTHTLGLKVTDGVTVATGTIQVTVQGGSTISWVAQTVQFDAKLGKDFSATLRDKVVNPSGAPLTFARKTQDAAWATLKPNGDIVGVPTTFAQNSFVVTVSNSMSQIEATVTFRLTGFEAGTNTQRESFALDRCDVGSPVEVLWVVDFGGSSLALADSVAQKVGPFYDSLLRKGITPRSAYASTDGRLFRTTESLVFSSTDSQENVNQFRQREGSTFRQNVRSSAIFSVFSVLNSFSEWPQVYQETFGKPTVPLEVIAVTGRRDDLPYFSNLTYKQVYDAPSFVKSIVNWAMKAKKPTRVHLISPEEEALETSAEQTGRLAEAGVDRAMVRATGGVWLSEQQVADSMGDLGEEVATRACVAANRNLFVPAQSVKGVYVDGTKLSQGDGAYDFDSRMGVVLIHWEKVLSASDVHPTSVTVEYVKSATNRLKR